MSKLVFYMQKLQYGSWKSPRLYAYCCHHQLLTPFLINIFYFVSLSFLGFGILKSLDPRTAVKPRNIDYFFTSVSATTVSSMSTVEMEVFSNGQLIVMTVLMFIGGEVFTSMAGLLLGCLKVITVERVEPVQHISISPSPPINPIESTFDYNCKLFLGFVVLGYLLVIHVLGFSSVLVYLACIPSAAEVLRRKGLKTATFAIFTVVSTFSSCGFSPTNENMVVFSKNSGLLWILIPQVLLGNTLFPPALRVLLWGLGTRFSKSQARYLVQNSSEAGYYHLLPRLHSIYLTATVLGFIVISFAVFCSLDWNSPGLTGLSSYRKVVAVVFLCVNARHTGETITDLSTIAPAMLVFFIFVMYLPPYTSFLPIKGDEESSVLEPRGSKSMRKNGVKTLIFSQLSYLVISVILICITERKSMKEDPINFSVLNITVEVISAYGNVGFTTGYSCERQLRSVAHCVNKLYGFSGKWSDKGKGILILVMFLGRLKKFNMNGGQAWKLS